MDVEEKIEETTVTQTKNPEIVKKTTVLQPGIKTEHPQKVFDTKKTIFRTYQVIWFILSILETLLIFRFLLKSLGANPMSGFTNLIYFVTDPLSLPFQGILPGTITSTTSVLEWATIIAMIVYLIIAFGIVYLFQLVKPVTPEEVEEKVDNP